MKFLPLTLAALLTPMLFITTLAARANIDADNFPAELGSLEWREVGPYRGGWTDAVAGVSTDRNTYYRSIVAGDAKPTDQTHDVKAEQTANIEAHLSDLAALWMKGLPALQTKVRSLGLSLLVLPALSTKQSDAT